MASGYTGFYCYKSIHNYYTIQIITLIYNFKDMDKNKLDFIINHFNSLNELCNKIDNNKYQVFLS